ncbi:MAG: mannose-6-phosphate isomerase, class I [Bacteroidetes bacterium]|nr:mannose-6-phosphate isomerase, class I [Bacteroidota bacterium]
MIKAKPYKLFNKIQNYDWGTKNENAFIPNLIGMKPEVNLPYAELWIGAHPKASSEIIINQNRILLNEVIDKYPIEILGAETAEKFSNKLPFLLKVLSASRALSIQTHPDKEQAKRLHETDPINYPDNNHKPEIAVALDNLTAIAGFRPAKEIIENLQNNPEFEIITGSKIFKKLIIETDESKREKLIKKFYSAVMKKADDFKTMDTVIKKIAERISAKIELKQEEEQFLIQYENFGADVGLLSFFFFNIINLQPGQAIFTDAGVPHAYIEGNIIECMANSDNVVRAGLTNKFKDVDTLLDVLKYKFNEYKIINEEQKKDNVTLKTSAEEFQITLFEKSKDFTDRFSTNNKPVIILILEGSLVIESSQNEDLSSDTFIKGESFLIPALIKEYKLSCETDSKFVTVEIPVN